MNWCKAHFLKGMTAFLLLIQQSVYAVDIVKINIGRGDADPRHQYNIKVIHTALELTKPEFGPYEFIDKIRGIPSARLRSIVADGSTVNLAIAVARPEWEKAAVSVKIPIRRGILSYRLLMTNKISEAKFAPIETLNELKTTSVCMGRLWSTTSVMEKFGFNIEKAYAEKSILAMLDKNRCDFIPRGIHEIYAEMDIYKSKLQNLVVDPFIALHLPAPFYIYISPKETRLINRFKLGLEKMVQQGILKTMVENHYGKFIKEANLKSRRIIYLGNPELPADTPFERRELWMRWDIETHISDQKPEPQLDTLAIDKLD